MDIRTASEKDFTELHKFIDECNFLEAYPLHFYRVILRYFKHYCFIYGKNSIKGAAVGILKPGAEKIFFLWQIGITRRLQGKGMGREFLRRVEKKLKERGCSRIELTIDPSNTPSRKLFEKSGYDNISPKFSTAVKIKNSFALKDFYGRGRDFMLFAKKL